MAHSIVQYGIKIWFGLGIVASNKILNAQKSIIKIILNKSISYSSVKLFEEFKDFTV